VPDLLCGSGDQVYVEPGHDVYGAWGDAHPITAWTVESRPRPRVGLTAFVAFLDEAYRRSWSFETLDEVLKTTPSVMTWDDHEIRDGWGSQGDEHVYLDTYYAAARDAFLLAVHAHEEIGSPRGVGQALLGLAAVEAAAGHTEKAVAIAAAAHSYSQRAGVVVDHPMDPGVADRIQALKASIPAQALDGLVEQGRTLSPSAVLALVRDTESSVRRPGDQPPPPSACT
jgi:hypothetical protein